MRSHVLLDSGPVLFGQYFLSMRWNDMGVEVFKNKLLRQLQSVRLVRCILQFDDVFLCFPCFQVLRSNTRS